MAEPHLPLRGVTVLAWEQVVSLPMGTRMLAELGARVIRVDAPSRGRPRPRHAGNDLVRNKESLGLNLREPRAREIFKRLIQQSDVLCENFTPRVKREFGLTYEELTRERPDLIMLSVCGYGQTGRMSNRPTFGPGIEAASGHALLAGEPDQPPTRPGTIVYADNISGFYAAFAIISALLRRRLSGKGCSIDLAMFEASAYHVAPSIAQASLTGENPPRRGNGERAALVQGVYETKAPERWVAVTVYPEDGSKVATLLGCEASARALIAALGAWARGRSAEDAASALQRIGIAASPVLDARDLLHNAQLRHRDAFTLVQHAQPVNGYAAHPHAVSPMLFTGHERQGLTEAPAVGQDSRALLKELLGMSDEEIDGLAAEGIIAIARPSSEPVTMPADEAGARRRMEWRLVADYDPDPGRTLGLPSLTEVRS
jgi:crotonobetainyl-CoA:carnitine CoA-transferase CaiB-like acyl-CoA transferase